MTVSTLDRVLEEILDEPVVTFVLLQGPGGAIVASAGAPPRWAPGGTRGPPEADPWGRVDVAPDVVLDVGACHVLHVETSREPTDEELDRIRARFTTAL